MASPPLQLLTGPEVAKRVQVTAQTIRNWIDHGVLPAVRVGRAYRIRREDVDALLERASADSSSLATRRDLWAPTTTSLPRAHDAPTQASVWDGGDAVALDKPRESTDVYAYTAHHWCNCVPRCGALAERERQGCIVGEGRRTGLWDRGEGACDGGLG
jgi:excisionase family DNA binding protein